MIAFIKKLFTRTPRIVEVRSSKNGEDLTEYERHLMTLIFQCVDCESPLYEGPSGGCSTNFYCLNACCGSRFNLSAFGNQLVFAERITDRSPNATT